jgi:hypothetical protein
MAPYRTEPGQDSAIIYDTDGNVVWSSHSQTADNVIFDFRPCNYNGSSHLCMIEAEQRLGYARGSIGVYDDTLKLIRRVTAQNGLAAIDQHECALDYNETGVLSMVYNTERADMAAQNITTGYGWLQNSIFQRIDVETNALLYEWSSAEHVGFDESYVQPDSTEVVGTGLTSDSPWDYFHINSMDENADGDYIISARHTNALYKLSGTTGEVLWRLGGVASDFEFPEGLNFSSQHDARWLEHNETHEIISLFDNASNGFNRTANISSGMILSLDLSADPRTVTLLASFLAPPDIPISNSQGNMQVFNKTDWANSNTFCGWGNVPVVTEHTPDGSIIFQGNVEIDNDGVSTPFLSHTPCKSV